MLARMKQKGMLPKPAVKKGPTADEVQATKDAAGAAARLRVERPATMDAPSADWRKGLRRPRPRAAGAGDAAAEEGGGAAAKPRGLKRLPWIDDSAPHVRRLLAKSLERSNARPLGSIAAARRQQQEIVPEGYLDATTPKPGAHLQFKLVLSEAETVELLTRTARREPLTQEGGEHPPSALVFSPVYPHPLPTGIVKYEHDLAMKQLRTLEPDRRAHAAACVNGAWCLEDMYMKGIRVDVPNKENMSPIHIAAQRGFQQCVRVLLNIGVEINRTTVGGVTPLWMALAADERTCAKLLQDAGAVSVVYKPLGGYRGILDLKGVVSRPTRALDLAAQNLGVAPYTGQY